MTLAWFCKKIKQTESDVNIIGWHSCNKSHKQHNIFSFSNFRFIKVCLFEWSYLSIYLLCWQEIFFSTIKIYCFIHHIIAYHIILYYNILYCFISYYIILHYITLHDIILYYIMLHYIISYYIILYSIILYHTILYHIIFYYIISYYIIKNNMIWYGMI